MSFVAYNFEMTIINPKVGNRVRVVPYHKWFPERTGTIKKIEKRTGNRFIVKFDEDELGVWHDEDGDPVLMLGDTDLAYIK